MNYYLLSGPKRSEYLKLLQNSKLVSLTLTTNGSAYSLHAGDFKMGSDAQGFPAFDAVVPKELKAD